MFTTQVGLRRIQIIINLRSTHYFLDERIGWKLGNHTTEVNLMHVTVANGYELTCKYKRKDFKFRMQGRDYVTKVFLLSLNSYDMVLGVQWLSTM